MRDLKKIMISVRARNNAFLLQGKDSVYLGYRRKVSDRSRYSILEKEMLIGEILSKDEQPDRLVFFISRPNNDNWRTEIFHDDHAINIHFPWPPVDRWGNEIICPESFWENASIKPSMLDDEETHFREHTLNILQDITFSGCRIYDPACSTGKFLSYILNDFKTCVFLASDRSEKMVSLARNCLPDVFVCDIMQSKVRELQDIIFCRFANHEVIGTAAAKEILIRLFTLLNHKGHLIIFGHTPIACDIRKFVRDYGMQMKTAVGKSTDCDGIFQYYLLQKRV